MTSVQSGAWVGDFETVSFPEGCMQLPSLRKSICSSSYCTVSQRWKYAKNGRIFEVLGQRSWFATNAMVLPCRLKLLVKSDQPLLILRVLNFVLKEFVPTAKNIFSANSSIGKKNFHTRRRGAL